MFLLYQPSDLASPCVVWCPTRHSYPWLFLIYTLMIYFTLTCIHSSLLTFADNTKYFGPVTNYTPMNSSYTWHKLNCCLTGVLDPIYVSTLPNVHISFRANGITSYHLNEQVISKLNFHQHRDLGVIISHYWWLTLHGEIIIHIYS